VIIPAATYAFPLAYLTPADLAKLDRLYSRICKQAMGLPTCTPTAMILEDREKGGMGMPSLEVDYSDMVTRSLTFSLLDDGQLGMVSQALLYLQNSIVGSVAVALFFSKRTAYACNLVPTQHHQGEEIPREQRQICIAS